MVAPGAIWGSWLGPLPVAFSISNNSGTNQYAMAGLNAGWCARFIATSTKDIKSIIIKWATATTPGDVTIRIETIDATTGKPTGTLYDANAVLTTQVPAAGIQTYTFATTPTTGLTVGTAYGVVILTTTAGTAHTLESHRIASPLAAYPTCVLTAADGTTRSNFAEVGSSHPSVSFIMDDDTYDQIGCLPYAGSLTQNFIYSTVAAAMKFTTVAQINVMGIHASIGKAGTPAGNLRVRIFDSSNNVVSNTTVTADKDYIITATARSGMLFVFPSVVSLVAGTYRVVFDSADSANTSNCWEIRSIPFLSASALAANFRISTCPDVGTPVWTDSTTTDAPVALVVDADVQDPTDAAIAQAIWEYGNRTLTA